jgi:hypothetical protein
MRGLGHSGGGGGVEWRYRRDDKLGGQKYLKEEIYFLN